MPVHTRTMRTTADEVANGGTTLAIPGQYRDCEHLSHGGGGIRTHETLARSTVFKTAPFDRSGTPPARIVTATRG